VNSVPAEDPTRQDAGGYIHQPKLHSEADRGMACDHMLDKWIA
jgi:hypothetical protein